MHQVAEDVWQYSVMPRNGINVYSSGDVLVDAGTKQHAGGILKAVAGRAITAHAITHAHADHVGGSKKVAEALGVRSGAPPMTPPTSRRGRRRSPRRGPRRSSKGAKSTPSRSPGG